MRLPIKGRRLLVGGGVAVVALALAAGIAYATIPDGAGLIHGCYQRNEGQLRVIDPQAGGGCRPSEQPLSWNMSGPQGPPGPAGPPGPKGDPGATPTLSTYTVAGANLIVYPGQELAEEIGCDGSDPATGGGFWLSSGNLQLMSSVDTGQNSWWVEVRNPSTNSGFSFHAIVRCLKVS